MRRIFECPAVEALRIRYKGIFQDAPGSALLFGLWPLPGGYC